MPMGKVVAESETVEGDFFCYVLFVSRVEEPVQFPFFFCS